MKAHFGKKKEQFQFMWNIRTNQSEHKTSFKEQSINILMLMLSIGA